MKAIIVDPNQPGKLIVGNASPPRPAHTEALVRVHAFSLNRGEVRMTRAPRPNWRPGWDLAGIVAKAAEDGSGPPVGARVVGMLRAGAWAEQAAVPTEALAELPDAVTFAQAATLPVAGLTAYHALSQGGLLLSKNVLVTGASGGVGEYAIQLGRLSGASVTAFVRRPEQEAAAREAGAENVVVGETPAEAKTFGPFALIIDSVGGPVLGAHFGRLDVVVNNAGYGLMGALEEYEEAQMARNLATNFVGPLAVIRAALPILRAQKSGHIINLSAIAAFTNHAGFAVYGGAKAALDAASEALRIEVAPLGIHVTTISPGPFRTDFIGRSLEHASGHLEDYDKTSGKFAAYLEKINGRQPGDPDAAASALVQMVGAGKAPAQLFLGKFAVDAARKKLALMQRELDEWEAVSLAMDFAK